MNRVAKTDSWPYQANGFVLAQDIENPAKWHKGSGTMIGPNFVLTAGHVIKDANNQVRKVFIYLPAANDNLLPFSKLSVKAVYVSKKYDRFSKNERQNREFDYGMLVLDSPIGNATGWYGLAIPRDLSLEKQSVTISGYSGQTSKKNHYEMYTATGKVIKRNKEILTLNVTITKGQSGTGCVVSLGEDKIYCVGVLTLKKGRRSKFNVITPAKYADYVSWMKKHIYTQPFYKNISDWVSTFQMLQQKWTKSLEKKANENILSQNVSLKYDVSHPKTFLLLQILSVLKPKQLTLKNPSQDLVEILSVYFPQSINRLAVNGRIFSKSLTHVLYYASKKKIDDEAEAEGNTSALNKLYLPVDCVGSGKTSKD